MRVTNGISLGSVDLPVGTVNCVQTLKVETVSFAAHVDYKENRDFIRAVGAKHVILVHGEATQMYGARFQT
jgi:Cft2 family RNA processing exonuclease